MLIILNNMFIFILLILLVLDNFTSLNPIKDITIEPEEPVPTIAH